jgi:hypothetical protein
MRVNPVLRVAIATMLSTLSSGAFAAPCMTTTLDNWLVSGFSCTVGTDTFSNFSYNPSGFNAPASTVGVTPIGAGTSAGPGIVFNGGWSNTGTTNLDAILGFTVTAPATAPITDASLDVSGVLPGTDFTDVETLSNGTTLAVNETAPTTTTHFAATTMLNQEEDFEVFPGTGAAVGVSILDKQFSDISVPVPEPVSLALLGTALFGFGIIRRRRHGV